MAEVSKDHACGLCFLYVVEESNELCFYVGGEYVTHNRGEDEDGSVDGGCFSSRKGGFSGVVDTEERKK